MEHQDPYERDSIGQADGVRKMFPPAGARKHLFFEIDIPGHGELWVDLTVLRKSKTYDSVPLYTLETDELSFCGFRSAKFIHKLGVY